MHDSPVDLTNPRAMILQDFLLHNVINVFTDEQTWAGNLFLPTKSILTDRPSHLLHNKSTLPLSFVSRSKQLIWMPSKAVWDTLKPRGCYCNNHIAYQRTVLLKLAPDFQSPGFWVRAKFKEQLHTQVCHLQKWLRFPHLYDGKNTVSPTLLWDFMMVKWNSAYENAWLSSKFIMCIISFSGPATRHSYRLTTQHSDIPLTFMKPDNVRSAV